MRLGIQFCGPDRPREVKPLNLLAVSAVALEFPIGNFHVPAPTANESPVHVRDHVHKSLAFHAIPAPYKIDRARSGFSLALSPHLLTAFNPL